MRLAASVVLIFCTCCQENLAETTSQAPHADPFHTVTALALQSEIYGPDDYRIVHLRSPESSEQLLRLLRNGAVLATVSLPVADEEVKNFSLSGIEETREGFKVTADWGGGSYFYTRVFHFTFTDGGFFLQKIEFRRFDQRTEEQVERHQAITPAIPFHDFEMPRFLDNE